ncbi:16S rRNA (uracil(1498)-N(3))-methyltransferase [Gluconacetobacter tumulisoli]|uniref:Ribosomal RNA small subunit methyltransferase E n=1 Tax=Gluconacetobacter tumulisoli TaxID=1286189 RepID=A0A7W4K4Y0_9PROT|nr:16S rRNA (uracil(1498)-N(3))-methyltransferase [Gluconacetobacter tumulisoli]MBB2200343.1 16S rRNA (uracil(1498)-N(3))-methyltransferase [Gluconacetobacter tumulisoli]
MKDCPRLFVDPATQPPMQDGAILDLMPAHAHYLGTVLRLGAGDEVALFNARDGEWLARIEAIRRDRGQVRLHRQVRPPTIGPEEAATGPVLLFAPLKRDATDLVIRMGTELGVGRFLPVLTERTNTHRVNGARLAAIAVEAAEQCERLDVPEVEGPLPLVDRLAAWPQGRRLFVAAERPAQRDGAADVDAARDEGPRDGDGLLVGPEGGFSAAEVALLRSRPFVTMISLGPRILRADTAVACGLSLMGAGFRRASGAGSR